MSEVLEILYNLDASKLKEYEREAIKIWCKKVGIFNQPSRVSLIVSLDEKSNVPTNPFREFDYIDPEKYAGIINFFNKNECSGYFATEKEWVGGGFSVKINQDPLVSRRVYKSIARFFAYEQVEKANV